MGTKIIKLLAIFAVLFSAMVVVGGTTTVAAQPDKVTVCHKPGTPAEHELTMSERALPAHLNHGDTVGPCGPPAPQPQPCNATTQAGGEGVTTTTHELGVEGPTSFQLTYQMYSIPDQLDVFYEGDQIFTTGGPVSGGNTVTVNVPDGTSTQVSVVVTGPSGTAWDYIVNCPAA